MNWYKAKTILIVFFIITNLFLFYNIIFGSQDEHYINDDVVLYTAQILKNNQIFVDTGKIPRKKVSAAQFEADNIISSYEEFSKKILGDECTKISENSYQSSAGTLDFSGDRFTATIKSYPQIDLSTAKSALSVLDNLNIKISDYEYENGRFTKKINNLEVFDCELKISQNQSGELTISGVWFEKNSKQINSGGEMKPITTVLIDFISDAHKPQGEINIKNLGWGYMVYETDTYHKSIVPVPVWKLEFSDGNYVCMDARAN